MPSSAESSSRELPWLADQVDALAEQLVEGGALGIITIEATPLAQIEQRYGARVLRGSMDVLVESVLPLVAQATDGRHMLLGQALEPERLLLFCARPRSDSGFYAHTLPKLARQLREHVSLALQRISYPYLTGVFDVPVGHAVVLHRPFQRPETEIRRLLAASLSCGIFEAERMRRTRGAELERLILEERLSTRFEPIVSLHDGTTLGYEALTRGPTGTLLESPLVCFNVAERCDLEFELDHVCRRLALRNAQGLGRAECLFLNILPSSIHDSDFSDRSVRGTLAELEITPAQVVFEISERQAIGNFPRFREVIDYLKGLGFHIAIDDIGTGYANLETAIELAPDFLKVDRSLIHRIDDDPHKQELISAMVRLGDKMNARLIAEGVENDAERTTVRDLGVSYGQGYGIAVARTALQ